MGLLDAPPFAAILSRTRWPEYAPQTRPAFLDQAYGFCLGAQGYIPGQGLVNTTLTVAASAEVGNITVASATGIVANMTLTIAVPTSPVTFPLRYQNVVVASVSGSVVTLAGGHINQGFPVGAIVVSTWLNDSHLNYWPAWVQWLFDTRLRSALTGKNLLSDDVAQMTTWTGGALAVPDGWTAIGTATFVRTVYSPSSVTANARQNAADNLARGVQVTSVADGDGMRITEAKTVVLGQRLVVNLLAKRVTAPGNDSNVAIVDGSTNAVLASVSVPLYGFDILVPISIPVTIPPGTTSIKVQVTGNAGAATYISDVRILAGRQDTSSNLRSIRDPGSRFGVVLLGDSWGVNATASFLTALRTFYGSGASIVDGSVSGETLAQQLLRLPALLNGSTRPSVVVHMSGFMNDGIGVVTTPVLVAQVQQMVAMCRDSGTTLVMPGCAPRNSELAAYMARNESIRTALDVESAALYITDTSSLTSFSD